MLGSWDAYQERKKNKIFAPDADNQFSKDFAKLDTIFGKQLSSYMQNISGATVGDKEVERLQRQVPNMDMDETTFEESMKEYEKSLRNARDYFLEHYWFNDFDTARKVVFWKKSEQIQKPAESQGSALEQALRTKIQEQLNK